MERRAIHVNVKSILENMKIVVTGTRGIPAIPGGVETHCEELYPRIAALGHDVTVIRRSPYIPTGDTGSPFKGVKLIDIFAPKKKKLEATLHTFLAVLKASRMNPDLVHIHAVGPSLMVPVARLLGLKVVTTNHGPDYNRQKWGKLAKHMLRLGEKWGAKYSNKVIVISKTIADILADKYGRTDTDLIYNGVNPPVKSTRTDYIESIGIYPGDKYFLTVGRFVKEKGFHDLIDAYVYSGIKDFKLVIAGDSDHPDAYSESLKQKAKDAGVILTGFIKGEKLNQVFSNASVFVLPSYHEGLPISLLEAMSYNIDVVVSDIDANKLECLADNDFFHVGDISSLTSKLTQKAKSYVRDRKYDLSAYNWDVIADKTLEVYRQVTMQE